MPRCKNIECRKLFEKKRPNQVVCSPQCAYAYQKQQRDKKEKREWNKKKKEIKESLKTKKDYEKELQVIFNSYIRERDKGKGCISCGKPNGAEQAGHYRSVGSSSHLRFDERNCHGQCIRCNMHLHGNAVNYRIGLVERFGEDYVQSIESDNTPRRYSIPEIIEMKVKIKDKLRSLKNK